MKKAKQINEKNIQLFNSDELNEIEQLRADFYSKYEHGNPQFADDNYQTWIKGKSEGGHAHTTVAKRSLWALVGYDYSVANYCIKDFLKTGDLNHVLNAIEVLWTKAFRCPVVIHIILNMNVKYSLSLWMGDKSNSKLIESFFEGIGLKLLFDSPKIIKPHKSKLIIRKLQVILSERFKQDFTIEDTFRHIGKIYSDSKKELKNDPAFKPDADRELMIQTNNSLLIKTKEKLRQSTNKKQIQELKKEIKDLENIVNELNSAEDEIYKEARKQTLEYLEKETGIRLGNRNFAAIISLINKNNLT